METRDFCYWLQGIFEGNPDLKKLNAQQTEIIERHLEMTFRHSINPETSFFKPMIGGTTPTGEKMRC